MDVPSTEIRENSELALRSKASSLQSFAETLVITDQETFQMAADVRGAASELDKRIVEFFKPMKDAAHKAHKAIVEQEKIVRANVQEAITTIDRKLVEWRAEEPAAKADGMHTRDTWSANVTDLAALVQFVAANQQFLDLLEPNHTALNALARAQHEAMNIPGVKAVVNRIVISKGGEDGTQDQKYR